MPPPPPTKTPSARTRPAVCGETSFVFFYPDQVLRAATESFESYLTLRFRRRKTPFAVAPGSAWSLQIVIRDLCCRRASVLRVSSPDGPPRYLPPADRPRLAGANYLGCCSA